MMMVVQGDFAVEIKGLAKSFGSNLALGGIDLAIERGKTLAIFGPNGAGKTTLIKILATIMKPSAGEILIDGLSLKESAQKIRQRIGVVTHQTFLYGNLTAYENLKFYCRMYGLTNFKQRIYEVTAMVGMEPRLYDKVNTLSRGMQQRLSIARALLHDPAIMLLDEPETGLDQQATSMLWTTLKKEESGRKTIILTSHSLERGLAVCDQVAILNRGKLACQKPSKGLGLAGLRQAYMYCTGATDEIC
jgi:heme exporter protein A